MNANRYLISGMVAGLLAVGGIASPPAVDVENAPQTTEQWLGKPSNVLGLARSQTPNGCRIAWKEQRGTKVVVIVDGQSGPEYDDTGKGSPVFSPDGKRVAYAAREGNKWFVVVDGQAGLGYDGIGEGTPIFSPDGKHVAYGARKGAKWLVVVDGQSGLEYNGIVAGTLVFSPDGKHVAFSIQEGNKSFVVVDGQTGPGYDGLGIGAAALVFSPDGKRVAYAAWKREGDKCFVIVDGQSGPEYDAIGESSPVFSPDGKRVAYRARKSDKWVMVVDGESGPEYDAIGNNSPVFSPDGKLMAYSAQKGDKWAIVVGGESGPGYDGIGAGSPLFSPDGKHVGYGARRGAKWSVVVDGRSGPEYDRIGSGSPVFSPDGKRVAYTAGKASKWFVVVAGHDGPEYDGIAEGRPVFSPDGKCLAYSAKKGDKWFVIVDGQQGPEYEACACGPVFLKDGTVEYIAVKGDSLFRIQSKTVGFEGSASEREIPQKSVSQSPTRTADLESTREHMAERSRVVPDLELEMVYIEPGSFQMGSNNGPSYARPVHMVQISRGYWIGKCEVTNAQYQRFLEESNYDGAHEADSDYLRHHRDWTRYASTGENYPIVCVSWKNTVAFCQWLTERERKAGRLPPGYVYRLPTEAEWEYAARGGAKSRGFEYAGSGNLDEVAWYGDNHGTTHPVAQKKPNELGLYDMSGNVWERCQDWYAEDYYGKSPLSDPQGPPSGDRRVVRGGGWLNCPANCSSAERISSPPQRSLFVTGFRVALGPELSQPYVQPPQPVRPRGQHRSYVRTNHVYDESTESIYVRTEYGFYEQVPPPSSELTESSPYGVVYDDGIWRSITKEEAGNLDSLKGKPTIRPSE